MSKPHLLLVGGFLGAGKTTAVARLAAALMNQGLRVAVVTNDQGNELVDTQLLSACGLDVQEISGGCFCCRFDHLAEATRRLGDRHRPDAFIAEAVGSCTDLVATVAYPFQRLFSDRCTVGPLSVLVDPERARRAFALTSGARFAPDVEYIFGKQLEEADLIVISKTDTIAPRQLAELTEEVARRYPLAEVMAVSAVDGSGIDSWAGRIARGRVRSRQPMSMDYKRYADGEALLGWLNASVELAAIRAIDGNALLTHVAEEQWQALHAARVEVAHLKMTLRPRDTGGLASIHLVRSDQAPRPGRRLTSSLRQGELTVNLRAQGAPETLETALHQALAGAERAFPGVSLTMRSCQAFRPGAPNPPHRDDQPPPQTLA